VPSSKQRLPCVAVTSTTEIIRGVLRVRVNAAYTDALARAGLAPLVVPPLPAATAPAILAGVAGLVLTGGEDVAPRRYGAEPHASVSAHEGRDECELALAAAAHARRLPTLAIWRGVQLLNVAFGGSLIQDIPSERPHALSHDPGGARSERVHDVRVAEESRLAAALGADRLSTNSFHHQALDRIAPTVRVVACAADGIVEGVEAADPRWWLLGVQWHPEELTETPEPWDRNLFEAFATAVRERV
jgi:putative glutamine amidotransferase